MNFLLAPFHKEFQETKTNNIRVTMRKNGTEIAGENKDKQDRRHTLLKTVVFLKNFDSFKTEKFKV